ncbi:MAG: hypothetical protein QOF48_3977 [Verrucomicrobiota bacterium]|jgi:RNA polymerase sigma factor (sigma-70 family)
MDDWELLQAYAHKGSEAAFQRLVERYVGQVHSMALREMRDPHRAQDVTQAVFLILVKKAGALSRNTVLAGWLFKVTRHVAMAARRGERRRQEREMQALQCAVLEPENEAASQVEAGLNDALASLGESDRNALMLRYIQQRSVPDVAASLGTSQEAAQKRIERAVEKLRRYFGRRGVAVPAVALMGVVSAQAAQPAPPLLIQAIGALGIPSAPAVSAAAAGLMAGTLNTMLLSKVIVPVVVAVGALLLTWPIALLCRTSTTVDNRRSFDLAQDFSSAANPSGPWSYGWASQLASGDYVPLTVQHTSGADGAESIPSWQLTPGQTPAIYKNTTPNMITVGGGAATIPPGTVWIIPGETGRPENFGIIRFTVPAGDSGFYRIEAAVRPNYDGPPQGDSDFHVLHNRNELFGRFLSPTENTGFTNTLRLAEGDIVDFAVGRGADGRQFGSALRIHAMLRASKAPSRTSEP